MKTITLTSPAKVNLYLKVLNKRADGFHDIDTIFQRINLEDKMVFSPSTKSGITIRCRHPHVPLNSENLIYKAATLLADRYNKKLALNIELTKNIPVAAGLAGGSSNCATTILALNALWKLNLNQKQLLSCGQELGSDVNFFLLKKPWARAKGRGEQVNPIDLNTSLWQVIVVPKIQVYTWKVYGALNLQLTKKKDNATILIRSLKKNDVAEVARNMENDLQRVVFDMAPRVEKPFQMLKNLGLKGVMVSGSGPSVYGLARSYQQACEVAEIVRRRYHQVFVVKTLIE